MRAAGATPEFVTDLRSGCPLQRAREDRAAGTLSNMYTSAKRPILVVNPADDDVFGDFAHVLVKHGASSTGELERRLRPIYSRAVVHARELSSEPFVIWYVYREGRWVNPRPETHHSNARRDDSWR